MWGGEGVGSGGEHLGGGCRVLYPRHGRCALRLDRNARQLLRQIRRKRRCGLLRNQHRKCVLADRGDFGHPVAETNTCPQKSSKSVRDDVSRDRD